MLLFTVVRVVVGNVGGDDGGGLSSCSVVCAAAAAGREFYHLLHSEFFHLCASLDVAKFIKCVEVHKLSKYDSANTPIILI